MAKLERRHRRSDNTSEALRLQLEECRKAANLEAFVLSDEDGLCLAASGDETACGEVAARLPLLGRKVKHFDGVLLAPNRGWQVRMERFEVSGSELYMAVIGSSEARDRELHRSIGGAMRILSPSAA